MSAHTPHELHDEFPHDARVLHLLKLADPHFCNLAERYHALNRAIHRIEVEVESASDGYVARLKRQRLALLDEISVILEEAEMRFQADRADSAFARPTASLHEGGLRPTASLHEGTPTPPAGGIIFGAPATVSAEMRSPRLAGVPA